MKPAVTTTLGDNPKVEFVDQIRSEEQKVIESLTEENKVLREGLEACEMYIRETGAIGLAVEMKSILAKAKTAESGGG